MSERARSVKASAACERVQRPCLWRRGFPVFLTRRVFDAYVTVPPNVTGQDEDGRLWDIVSMLRFAIKSGRSDGDRIAYSLYVRNDNRRPRLVNPKCGSQKTLTT